MKTCFIIMPFSYMTIGKKGLNQNDVNYIYTDIIKKAVEEYNEDGKNVFREVKRYDAKLGSIIEGIVSKLNDADLVIADLSGMNPNVMYELGVRHSLKRGTIIITQNKKELPSDLRDYMCIEYSYSSTTTTQAKNYAAFKLLLHETIEQCLHASRPDSPVISFLHGKERYWREDEIKKLKQLIIVCEYINDQFDLIANAIKSLDSLVENKDFMVQVWYSYLEAHFANLQGGLNDLNVPYENLAFYEVVQAAKATMSDIQKKSLFPGLISGLGGIISDKERDMLDVMRAQLFETKIINHFKMIDGDYEVTTIREVFAEGGSFADQFIGVLQDFIEQKTKALGVLEKEIDLILDLEEE